MRYTKEDIVEILNTYNHDKETLDQFIIKFVAYKINTDNPDKIIKEFQKNRWKYDNDEMVATYNYYIAGIKKYDIIGRNNEDKDKSLIYGTPEFYIRVFTKKIYNYQRSIKRSYKNQDKYTEEEFNNRIADYEDKIEKIQKELDRIKKTMDTNT